MMLMITRRVVLAAGSAELLSDGVIPRGSVSQCSPCNHDGESVPFPGIIVIGKIDDGVEALKVPVGESDHRTDWATTMRSTMPWSADELCKIAETDDLYISPFRNDGVTYGTPTWIWSVAVDGALYVRGYNGQNSRWYQAAVRQKAGRIIAAGMTKEVTFDPVEDSINDRIDNAYRAKYRGSQYLNPMIGARARSATVKVMPRTTAK